jgi:glutathionyl-hydroquinone reductase
MSYIDCPEFKGARGCDWYLLHTSVLISLDVSITGYKLRKNGWDFTANEDGCTVDPVNNFPHTKAIYHSVDPNYNLRYTIPILYDKKTKKIVNNESSEIIRFFNSEFDEFVDDEY